MQLNDLLRQALIKNELGGNMALVYRFSDADGVRTGKSGYSFGVAQFDIANNHRAIECLKECGFTDADIARLRTQTGPIGDLNDKLAAHKSVVDLYDTAQIDGTINWVRGISKAAGIVYADDEAFIHACDYHNQYDMKAHGKAISYLAKLGRPVTGQDIHKYKLGTIWGKKRPDDVERRYNNIRKLFATSKGA
ncbi:hypothetical protein FY034_13010 [Trichlorobacter lovleyi]|uniref:hypothetical protein n=1 Tax=Trichlorobacter lovleyi TaxID=313985 RepID=UPI002240D1E6|nr:hypothetical protein [Trichlorobacter lovleyi]QOX79811.1 hypothetical protein FY034_13010 [Trichlorobacter lovleyi]